MRRNRRQCEAPDAAIGAHTEPPTSPYPSPRKRAEGTFDTMCQR